MFSNSGMNPDVYNPAVILNNGMINLQMLVRRQWVGFPDAPSVEHVRVSHFFDDQSMGLKLSVMNQSFGKEISRNVSLAYVYKVNFDPQISMNLGLSAGLVQRQILFSNLVFQDGSEPLIRPDENYLRPDFAFGMHLNAYDFDFGYATSHLTTIGHDPSISRIPLHQHLYAFYQINLGDVNDPKFRTGVSYHQQGKVQYLQIDAQFYRGMLQAGIGWRHTDSFILKAGLRISEFVEFAYSYDMGITRFANFNSGTHEFVVHIRLNRKSNAYLSPRFMDY